MQVQIPQGLQFLNKKENKMSKLLYDYTQMFIKESTPDLLIDRKIIIKYEKGGDLNVGAIVRIMQKKDGNRWIVEGLNGRQRTGKYVTTTPEMEFIPVTPKEMELAMEEMEEKKEEFKEQVECMKELNIDQINSVSFTAWKIFKACKEEKDQEKLKKIIVDSIDTISNGKD